MIAGGDVTETIRVDLSGVSVDPRDFMNIMLSAIGSRALAAVC